MGDNLLTFPNIGGRLWEGEKKLTEIKKILREKRMGRKRKKGSLHMTFVLH